ncbi:MAG: hypothetical protein H7331_04190 [Bacteroidia bacterium]|nr:hypothetical protein [Bacteroidia bacterium]
MNNEQYRRDFLNNLIAVNSFAEILADQENPEPAIINKLKERTLQLYQTLVAIEFDSKINTLQVSVPNTLYEATPEPAVAPSVIESNNNFVENSTISLTYSNTDLHEFNNEISELFTASETIDITTPIIINEVSNEPEFIVNSTPTQPTLEPQFITPTHHTTPNINTRTPLKNFLGFNDKIQIQNDLFSGSNGSLTDFMTVIDNCETSQRAIGVINEYKSSLKWDKESEAFYRLIATIEQKFR